jgi:hypothetical protein
MSFRYHVKSEYKGKPVFGVVDSYSDDAKRYAEQGILVVVDAVYPKSYAVPEASVVDIPYSLPKFKPGTFDIDPQDDYERYIEKERKQHEERARAAPEGLHVHKLFSIGVADGQAWYVVTKVNKKTVKVEWRGFGGGDRYTDHWLGWGGTFDRAKIEQMVLRNEALEKLFSRKRASQVQ